MPWTGFPQRTIYCQPWIFPTAITKNGMAQDTLKGLREKISPCPHGCLQLWMFGMPCGLIGPIERPGQGKKPYNTLRINPESILILRSLRFFWIWCKRREICNHLLWRYLHNLKIDLTMFNLQNCPEYGITNKIKGEEARVRGGSFINTLSVIVAARLSRKQMDVVKSCSKGYSIIRDWIWVRQIIRQRKVYRTTISCWAKTSLCNLPDRWAQKWEAVPDIHNSSPLNQPFC